MAFSQLKYDANGADLGFLIASFHTDYVVLPRLKNDMLMGLCFCNVVLHTTREQKKKNISRKSLINRQLHAATTYIRLLGIWRKAIQRWGALGRYVVACSWCPSQVGWSPKLWRANHLSPGWPRAVGQGWGLQGTPELQSGRCYTQKKHDYTRMQKSDANIYRVYFRHLYSHPYQTTSPTFEEMRYLMNCFMLL